MSSLSQLARTVTGAEDVEDLLDALLGPGTARLHESGGVSVVHVTAAVMLANGDLHALRIGPQTPKSACDAFVLGASRARAQVILASGRTLRSEPALRYELAARLSLASALSLWRIRLGLGHRIAVGVLTRGQDRELPSHAALQASNVRPLVLTPQQGAARLRQDSRGHAEIVGLDQPSPAAAARWLVEHVAPRLSIELGPSSAGELYGDDPVVDELWLSRYLEPLDARVVGPRLASEERLAEVLRPAARATVVREESGRWSFQRWIRRS